MDDDSESPPELPSRSPPSSPMPHSSKIVKFSLSTSVESIPETVQFLTEFALLTEESEPTVESNNNKDIESEQIESGESEEIAENSLPPSTPTSKISTEFQFLQELDTQEDLSGVKSSDRESTEDLSWEAGNSSKSDLLEEANTIEMIIEEIAASAAATKAAEHQIYRSSGSKSIANSIDSLAECPQINEFSNVGQQNDRSQSLGDLTAPEKHELNYNGSYDNLMSNVLTDSGIDNRIRDELSNYETKLTDMIFGNIDVSKDADISIASNETGSNSENDYGNSSDNVSRLSHEDRKQPELPAISEESEHEHNTTASGVDRDELEHSYPMTHCSSEPSNAYATNFAHRRVVSDDVTETHRLKRSSEIENVNRIGEFDFDAPKPSPLKSKGRCKSLMLVVQETQDSDGEEDDEDDEDDDYRDSRDSIHLLSRSNELSPKKSTPGNLTYMERNTPATQPPPVRISRKMSATTTRSTPLKSSGTASEQSWRDRMIALGSSSHMIYSSQVFGSKNDRQSPPDFSGTITGGTTRITKPNKKEKSGSDTFTFGNFFKKKANNRTNLNDIIVDLNQRSSKQNIPASIASSNRRSTSASILPTPDGVMMEKSNDGLPDHISRLVSGTEHSDLAVDIPSSSSVETQLEKHWGKYDLFSPEEYQTWHEKYRHNSLSQKQVKKQDAIYELYLMEKRHCANIAFLLQGYRRRMIEENVISKHDMDALIPDVLEPLLIFHLNVLERITERIKQSVEVDTISDIICEELDVNGGKHTKLCCDAYTDFGVAKEKSDHVYNHLMNKNAKFADFIRRTCHEEPIYKRYEFKPLITKIIGRATKYSLLLESILKNEQQFSEQYDLTHNALETARRFAHKIDENLQLAHMSRKWDEIRMQIDPSSHTYLYVPDPLINHSIIQHHFDINSLNAVPNRKLVHIGEVFVKYNVSNGTHSSSSGKTDKLPVILVLFDDIIVLLYRKGSRLHFMQDQGALPAKTLLTRQSARGHSVMLISGGKPVLYELSFKSTTERKKWVQHLEEAPARAPPEGVRLSVTNAEEMIKQRALIQQKSEDDWLKKLDEMFQSRIIEEEKLSTYLESRLQFFDDVRAHMANMPFKTRHDISDRVREAVRMAFRELRRARTTPLNRLVDLMAESRDSDLWSYFDERADFADVIEKASDFSDDSSSANDSSSISSRAKPRRIKTFHCTTQIDEPTASNDPKNGNNRRHTTVPRVNSVAGTTNKITDRAVIEDDEDQKIYEEMISNLPLRQSDKSRKASTRLIKEVIWLRKENHLLKNDNALTKSRCALLERSRGSIASISSTASAVDESMEALRKKEKEIREMQQRLIAEKEEMVEKKKALEAQEKEIQSKWTTLQQRSNDVSAKIASTTSSPVHRSGPQAFQNTEWSPVLANLATKTETKKVKK